MQLAKVLGTATSTVKHRSMHGQKLLVVQPLLADETAADGFPFLAVDQLGAGRGEVVVITSDGKAVREALKSDNTPVRWSVVGIRDDKQG